MDYLRRLFTQTRKEHLVQGINDKVPLKTTELFVDQLQSSANLNELDAMNNKDRPITDPLQLNEISLDQENTQKNVTSTEIGLNNANETTTIFDINDISKDETISKNPNNNDDSSIKVGSFDVIANNKKTEQFQVKNDTACKGAEEPTSSTTAEDKDDATLKNLKEFEDTLKEFNETSTGVNCGHEIIDLDEFEEFVGLDRDDTINNILKVDELDSVICDLNNDELNITTLENVDIISIVSSTDNAKRQIINTQDLLHTSSENETPLDGYNSSDFEFITEEEANMDGFIININRESPDLDHSSASSSEPSTYLCNKTENIAGETTVTQKDFMDFGAGPSGSNKSKHEFEDRSYRNDHILPEGDEYLGLFRGIYNPLLPVCEIFFLENKSVRASAMNVQYDGIGFYKQLMHKKYKPDSSEDEFEDEAKKCAQKIITMYPGENRKRRRRF